MFPNVCKHYLIIYGCLKFTFKKIERIEKKLKKKIKIVKIQNYFIPDI